MAFLSNLTRQLGVMLKSQSAAQRMMMLGVMAAALIGLVWITLHARTGGYVTLYPSLAPNEAGEAMVKLRQMGIDAKMENGGTALLVSRNRFDEAAMALAMEGIPGNGTVGFELMDKNSLGQSKFQQEKNYHRMREGELARTLLSIREVENARVHLALPENSLFVKDEKPASASIVLKLRSGSRLTERQINGITHLISHSIEGLDPENVTIIDNQGNPLNPPKSDSAVQSTLTQQSFKTEYEDLLKNRIESMLENVVGRGKVSARIQANFDFSTIHEIKETYNPDEQSPIIKMQKSETETRVAGSDSQTGNPAGSDANMPGGDTNGTNGDNNVKTGQNIVNNQTTDYVVSKTWSENEQNVPLPKRVTVAVLVDGNYEAVTDSKGKQSQEYRDRSPEELKKLEDLVKAAIGFNAERQDEVKVMSAQFKMEEPEPAEKTILSIPQRELIRMLIEWGVVGGVALLLILLVLRPAIKQIVVTPVREAEALLPGSSLAQLAALTGPDGKPVADQGQLANMLQGGLHAEGNDNFALPSGPKSKGSFNDLLSEIDDGDIPDELKGNEEAIRAYRLQRMAAKQARLTQAQSQRMHEEVIETARSNPQKTVSLIRQWMEEA